MTDPNPEHYGHDIPFMYDGADPRRALWHSIANPKPTPSRDAVEDALGRLAAGQRDEDDMLFMRELARCLLAASVGATRDSLPGDVLRASGLSGRRIDIDTRTFIDAVLKLEGFDGWKLIDAVRQNMHLLPDDDVDDPMTADRALRIIETERARRRK